MGKTRGQLVGVVILVVILALGAGPSAWAAEKVTVGIGGVGLMVYLPTVLAKEVRKKRRGVALTCIHCG